MKSMMTVFMAALLILLGTALAEEMEPVEIEMPVYESAYPEALEKVAELEEEDARNAMAALFVLEAEQNLGNFHRDTVTGIYWLQEAEITTLLVFHESGFWNIGIQETTYSAYSTRMEGIEDLDALIEYLRTEKGREYVKADLEKGFAQLTEWGLDTEPDQETTKE